MEHKFAGEGSFRVFLRDGFVHAALDNIEGMKDYEIPLETDAKVNDGLWHQINIELRKNFVNVTVRTSYSLAVDYSYSEDACRKEVIICNEKIIFLMSCESELG